MPASADGLEPAKRSGVLTPLPAWYGGSSASYWNFGVAGLPPADLYRAIKGFDQEGKPVFVDGQDSIIGAGPGEDGYSDFWKIKYYVVAEGFVPNSVKSIDAVMAGGYRIIESETIANCPVVEAGTVAGAEELHPGWLRDGPVVYFTFDRAGLGADARGSRVFFFVGGFNPDGSPAFAPGSDPVFEEEPGDPEYSALRRVHYVVTPPDFAPNSLRSSEAVLGSGLQVRETETYLNLPAVPQPAAVDSGGASARWLIAVPGALALAAVALFARGARRRR